MQPLSFVNDKSLFDVFDKYLSCKYIDNVLWALGFLNLLLVNTLIYILDFSQLSALHLNSTFLITLVMPWQSNII